MTASCYYLIVHCSMSSAPFLSTTSPGSSPYSEHWDAILGTALLACSLIGIPGNVQALRYFLVRERTTSVSVYLCIVGCDLLTSLLTLPPAISLLRDRHALALAVPTSCAVWGAGWTLTSRLSVFLVAVLSVTRVVALRRPFTPLQRHTVLTSILLYSVLLLGLSAVLPLTLGGPYLYNRSTVMCGWVWADSPKWVVTGLLHTMFTLPFVLPFPPTLVSCLLSIKTINSLHRPISGHESNNR